jgi:timeless protein
MMENTILTEEQTLGTGLGQQVGDNYIIHSETSQVLDNINKRLNEEDKNMRTYRRALAFSQMIQKDLVPILVNSIQNLEVFDAVIRLMVNLTVPVECLCSMEILNKSDVGRQTVFELSNSLLKTKEVFRDSRTTRVIMERLSRYATKDKISAMEVTLVNNCLLLIRNILHIPDSQTKNNKQRCSNQNQIMWNLFAQNLDKILLDLIKNKMSNIWCTSVVQLIALVYKDQHVITLQKLLQNFLESSLSESSEDNESNTSPQYQNGSCSPTTDDSSDQASRETSTPELNIVSIRERRHSSGSLEVLPNNSPAPSEEILSVGPPSPSSEKSATSLNLKRSQSSKASSVRMEVNQANNNENNSSGIDSEIFSTNDSEPPQKLYITENEKGEKLVHGRRSPTKNKEFVHKIRSPPKNSSQLHRSSEPTTEKVPHLQQIELHRASLLNKLNSKRQSGSGSDSSDVTGVPKSSKLPNKHQASDGSDYGYVTQTMEQTMEQEHQEMVSSSSNDDELLIRNAPPRTNPVKPRAKKDVSNLTPVEKKEKHRLKLLKRSKENRMRVKAMVNHIPTDKDISELLKEFTVDFLHNGYSGLVEELLEKLSKNDTDITMDKSHFLWLLTYFLKFASQLEIGLDQIGTVLSFRTLSYITYEGVELLETLELANRERRVDVSPHLRRMHLVVTALREFIQTVSSYNEIKNLCYGDKKHITKLQLQSLYTKEIRQLLLLLLRRFNPQIQSLQYLSDLIVCNHMLLMDLEQVSESDEYKGPKFSMTNHVHQFSNPELMRQYGRLLEEFEQNTPFVNDCIFTVMHHIAGDLNSPQVLYIPSILKSFSKIWEQGLQICDDWVDLIEYIIQKFIQTMGSSPHSCAANMVECLDYTEAVDECGFTGAQTSQLFWHFTQVENSKDPVGSIIEVYRQTDNLSLSRLAVIQALLSHGIITHAQYMNFIYMKSVMTHKAEHEGSVIAEVGSEHCNSDGHITDNDEPNDSNQESKNNNSEIQVLKDCLVKQGRESLIPWLQEVLLDACRVKMYPNTLCPEGSEYPHEPIPFYYNKAKQSIPLVPWNQLQYQGLQTEAFILMLHKLGFHLPADVGKVFPRIPHFWSADHIFTVALKIGPIDRESLKFSPDELEKMSKKHSDTEKLSVKNKGERMKPSHAQLKAEEIERVDNPNSNVDTSFMDDMDMMGSGLESMDLDLLEEGQRQGKPSIQADWLNLAIASKFSPSRSPPQSTSRKVSESNSFVADMDMD